MKNSILPVLLLALISCNSPGKVKIQDTEEVSNIGEERSINKLISGPLDTLNDPDHPSYMTNKDPEEFGRMILEDKVQPSDNIATFNILDSLSSKNLDDRQFYIKVFLHILGEADGALAEAMGLPAMNYVEMYPVEFAHLSANISDDNLDSWASYIGYEIYLSGKDDPIKEGEAFVKKLRSNYPIIDAKEKARLEKFNSIIIKTIQENIN